MENENSAENRSIALLRKLMNKGDNISLEFIPNKNCISSLHPSSSLRMTGLHTVVRRSVMVSPSTMLRINFVEP